ncbi:hypothetical protein OUZ56_029746 [Daphnia magna]|uniref:Uncharacterized protein n=1 Tax=Daphnia magna TaxID=35525 RepID=A0ABR0B7Q8_9CRUS|nr:hypothetical protein OUZ56_029746 [Daphnia magna]
MRNHLLKVGYGKRQVRQRVSNHFVSYWYDVLIWFVKKRYFDLSAGVVETASVIRLRCGCETESRWSNLHFIVPTCFIVDYPIAVQRVRRFEVQDSSYFHIVLIADGCVDRCAGSRN